MKTTMIAIATALMMATGSFATVAPAEAKTVVKVVTSGHSYRDGRRHRQVCRIVTKKKVVYRNGHRRVVVTKVRRCR